MRRAPVSSPKGDGKRSVGSGSTHCCKKPRSALHLLLDQRFETNRAAWGLSSRVTSQTDPDAAVQKRGPMINSQVSSDSAAQAGNGTLTRLGAPAGREPEQLRFYLEMVSTYLLIYAEYADQVVEYAESYCNQRARG